VVAVPGECKKQWKALPDKYLSQKSINNSHRSGSLASTLPTEFIPITDFLGCLLKNLKVQK